MDNHRKEHKEAMNSLQTDQVARASAAKPATEEAATAEAAVEGAKAAEIVQAVAATEKAATAAKAEYADVAPEFERKDLQPDEVASFSELFYDLVADRRVPRVFNAKRSRGILCYKFKPTDTEYAIVLPENYNENRWFPASHLQKYLYVKQNAEWVKCTALARRDGHANNAQMEQQATLTQNRGVCVHNDVYQIFNDKTDALQGFNHNELGITIINEGGIVKGRGTSADPLDEAAKDQLDKTTKCQLREWRVTPVVATRDMQRNFVVGVQKLDGDGKWVDWDAAEKSNWHYCEDPAKLTVSSGWFAPHACDPPWNDRNEHLFERLCVVYDMNDKTQATVALAPRMANVLAIRDVFRDLKDEKKGFKAVTVKGRIEEYSNTVKRQMI